MSEWLVVVHGAATWFMTGLIWFVQVVHYPLFASVGGGGFALYERRHQRRTTLVVGPAMLVEMATGVALVVARPADPVVLAMTALLAGNWLSTALVQVPCHRRLERGFDARAHRALVAGNWARTAMWSARSVLVAWLMTRGAA